MKFISILLSLASLSVSAQNSQWLWPIEGAKTGENIVCQPQDRIDKELNIGNLFIAAPEGTTVVAPVDGTIGALYVVANTSLKQSVTYGNDGGTFDKSREKLANDKKLPMGLNYIFQVCVAIFRLKRDNASQKVRSSALWRTTIER